MLSCPVSGLLTSRADEPLPAGQGSQQHCNLELLYICPPPCRGISHAESAVLAHLEGADISVFLQSGNATVPPSSYFTPPFAINNGNSQLPISTKTLPVTASHYDGTLEYNVHNMYGLYYTKASYQGLVNLRQKRPFILTRYSCPWCSAGQLLARGLVSCLHSLLGS